MCPVTFFNNADIISLRLTAFKVSKAIEKDAYTTLCPNHWNS